MTDVMTTNNRTWFGYSPAFVGGQCNIMSPSADEQLIKNDLLCLLLTLPGERIYRPTYGCPLRAYNFETSDPADIEGLKVAISNAIRRWEPARDRTTGERRA